MPLYGNQPISLARTPYGWLNSLIRAYETDPMGGLSPTPMGGAITFKPGTYRYPKRYNPGDWRPGNPLPKHTPVPGTKQAFNAMEGTPSILSHEAEPAGQWGMHKMELGLQHPQFPEPVPVGRVEFNSRPYNPFYKESPKIEVNWLRKADETNLNPMEWKWYQQQFQDLMSSLGAESIGALAAQSRARLYGGTRSAPMPLSGYQSVNIPLR